ncbi:MAG: SWIM zinc finger family protein [Halorhabdus sp.]
MNWRYYENRSPKEVEDGIEARSKRGDIGEQWWSRRFVNVVESYSKNNRITRGKRYARKGQVVDLTVENGVVSATVQGSQPDPYEVTIRGDALDEETWHQVERAMADRAAFAAQLLTEEMPPDIEEVFEACDVSLFPQSYRDMATNCTCPDTANPCKHIAAVFYILAEQFDEDPFLIFKWRGRPRETLLEALQELRGVDDTANRQEVSFEAGDERPIGECIDEFWTAGESLEEVKIRSRTARVADAALKRLGEPPAELTDVHERVGEYYIEMTK